MKPSFTRWLMISAGLGLVAPIVWIVALQGAGSGFIPDRLQSVLEVAWPSSFWLMATDGIEGSPSAYAFILMAVVANVILYSVFGSAVWLVRRFGTAKR
jgi:hypothetical protein